MAAATGMALLAFLGGWRDAYTWHEISGDCPKGLELALTHLPAKGPNTGKFEVAGNMYATRRDRHPGPVRSLRHDQGQGTPRSRSQATIDYIQMAQGTEWKLGLSGGYQRGCISITGWQIQALHAARLSKDVQSSAMRPVVKKAIAFQHDMASSGKHDYVWLQR